MRALRAIAALALAMAAGACGGSGGARAPDAARVPLVPGARILTEVKECDGGAAAYCAIELVVVDPAYHNARDLLLDERAHLHAHGWTGANGDTGDESAADSPGHKLHLIYATAGSELEGIDLGWIKRPRAVALSLSRTVFNRTAALAMMLELGARG